MVSTLKSQKQLVTISEWKNLAPLICHFLCEPTHLELIDGEIYRMSAVSSNHAGHLKRLHALLNSRDRAIVSVQNPVQLGDLSEPEPDLMLLKFTDDFYSTRHPQAKDVLLLVEVSDSTLTFDRNQKMRLYAAHQIQEYWILNLQGDCLEVYRQPQANGYAEKLELHAGDKINLLAFDDILIQVKDLF